jgi:hypothetical protein
MRIIYCDRCGAEIGEVSKDGVETKPEKLSLKIGRHQYPEVCAKCYGEVLEFVTGEAVGGE